MIQDLRHAVRFFRKSPGFAALAIATLALGIGANTAMFSIVRGVLLRPLPYRDSGRLMVARLSIPDYRDLTRFTRSFDDTAIWASNLYNFTRGAESDQMLGGVVSTRFFPLLSAPALGRVFLPEDARAPRVVLSDRLWRSHFGADPGVLGRTMNLSGKTYTVIGVMPPSFEFPSADFRLWVPFDHALETTPQQLENRSLRIFRMIGHRRAGVSERQASEEAAAISARLQKEFPDTNAGSVIRFQPLSQALLGSVRPALVVLLATVGLVLLIACANVANLTLARATGREREIAVRSALGAARGRLVRLLLTESVALAVAGGVLGALAAYWAVSLLPRFAPAGMPRVGSVHVDALVLLFALAVSVATGVLFGLVPALEASRVSLSQKLKEGGRGAAGSRRAGRVRHVLVVAEVALSVVVLVGAGLLVRSLGRLLHVDAGFQPSNLVTFHLELSRFQNPQKRAEVARAALERLAAIPGVAAAGGGTGLPPETPQRATRFAIAGRSIDDPDASSAYFLAVSPDYFRALGTRVLAGRAFSDRDRENTAPVVVISRGMADRLFPAGDAVGKTLKLVNPDQSDAWRTIVGVVENIRYSGLDDPGANSVYTPFPQTPFFWTYVMLRTPIPPATLAPSIREAVRGVDSSLVVARLRSMDAIVSGTVATPRFQASLLAGFGLLALLLAAIGIYGVISYGVSQRREEIGVRIALGAASRDVVRLIAGQGMRLVIVGVAAGLVGALAAARLLRGLLYEIGTADPITFAAIAVVLAAVGILASGVPALRASRVDPMTALRND
ncbi:MAG TPA: ABC transporter permease [Thermoanaerobaculia bacterium]|nr:ABC transporter permease [Thermoanaerobaculia bacterium]